MIEFLFFTGLAIWAIVRARKDLGKLEVFGYLVGIAGIIVSMH